ncbi:MAG: phosphomannomutase, partial [Anaerolineae bacterium]
MINPNIFREFSIRGVAGRDLSDGAVRAIGRAIGAYFWQRGKTGLVVGRDARLSSARIGRALVAGLTDGGMQVTDIGQVPTPVLNFTVDAQAAAGGVMITASHNPPEYNGLKIRTAGTLHGRQLKDMSHRAAAGAFDPPRAAGTVHHLDPLPRYLNTLKARANLRPLPVVIDGGSGTNGPL